MAGGAVLGGELLVGVGVVEPLVVVVDHAGADGRYFLWGVGEGDAVDLAVGDLVEVVGVGADPEAFPEVVAEGGVEVDGLAGLGGVGSVESGGAWSVEFQRYWMRQLVSMRGVGCAVMT